MSDGGDGPDDGNGWLVLGVEVDGPGLLIADSVEIKLVTTRKTRALRGRRVRVAIRCDRSLDVVRADAKVTEPRAKPGDQGAKP